MTDAWLHIKKEGTPPQNIRELLEILEAGQWEIEDIIFSERSMQTLEDAFLERKLAETAGPRLIVLKESLSGAKTPEEFYGFLSRSQQRIIKYMLSIAQPTYMSAVARAIGRKPSSISRDTTELINIGILKFVRYEVRKQGRAKLYQLNPKYTALLQQDQKVL